MNGITLLSAMCHKLDTSEADRIPSWIIRSRIIKINNSPWGSSCVPSACMH